MAQGRIYRTRRPRRGRSGTRRNTPGEVLQRFPGPGGSALFSLGHEALSKGGANWVGGQEALSRGTALKGVHSEAQQPSIAALGAVAQEALSRGTAPKGVHSEALQPSIAALGAVAQEALSAGQRAFQIATEARLDQQETAVFSLGHEALGKGAGASFEVQHGDVPSGTAIFTLGTEAQQPSIAALGTVAQEALSKGQAILEVHTTAQQPATATFTVQQGADKTPEPIDPVRERIRRGFSLRRVIRIDFEV